MAHFAELDDDNTVIRVIVIDDVHALDTNGEYDENVGAGFCHGLLGGRWVATSYHTHTEQNGDVGHYLNGTPFRGKYAGIGDTYDVENDVFVSPTVEVAE